MINTGEMSIYFHKTKEDVAVLRKAKKIQLIIKSLEKYRISYKKVLPRMCGMFRAKRRKQDANSNTIFNPHSVPRSHLSTFSDGPHSEGLVRLDSRCQSLVAISLRCDSVCSLELPEPQTLKNE